MRAIKFRAWVKPTKVMEQVVCLNMGTWRDVVVANSESEKLGITATYNVATSNVELMQFTGLYDNTIFEELTTQEQNEWLKDNKQEDWKGKPIYEDDILEYSKYDE